MKNNRARIQARRSEILMILRNSSHVSVRELAEKFQVSQLTVRRDLQFLENEHKLERFYGGAASLEEDLSSAGPDETACCRDRIARYAATLVQDDDTVFINTSSTALQMIPYITARRVTVITNNGRIMEVPWPADMSVILTGGELRRMMGAMTGEFAISTLGTIMAKKSFLGCDGLSAENGATTEILNAANVNRLMMERVTVAAYILADHTKIGKKSSFVICPPGRLSHVITDEFADPEELGRLREQNMEVKQVSVKDLR